MAASSREMYCAFVLAICPSNSSVPTPTISAFRRASSDGREGWFRGGHPAHQIGAVDLHDPNVDVVAHAEVAFAGEPDLAVHLRCLSLRSAAPQALFGQVSLHEDTS